MPPRSKHTNLSGFYGSQSTSLSLQYKTNFFFSSLNFSQLSNYVSQICTVAHLNKWIVNVCVESILDRRNNGLASIVSKKSVLKSIILSDIGKR